jgi:tetratricopeptide (TPR) repeat protein
VLPPGEETDLGVLFASRPGALRVQVDASEREPVWKSARFATVPIARGNRSVVLRAESGTTASELVVKLVPSDRSPAVADADRLRKAGDFEGALSSLTAAARSSHPVELADALGTRARVHMAMGNLEPAVFDFRTALALDARTGRLEASFKDTYALSYALMNSSPPRLTEARAALERLSNVSGLVGAAASRAYYVGGADYFANDVRAASTNLRRAADDARDRGDEREWLDASFMLAAVLQLVGERSEAVRVMGALAAAPRASDPCKEAEQLTNSGWLALSVADMAGAEDVERPDPIELLSRAAAILSDECPRPAHLASSLTALSSAYLAEGNAASARVHLEAARLASAEPDATTTRDWAELDASIALAEGDLAAATHLFAHLTKVAETMHSPFAAWRGLVGQALAQDALGRPDEASRAAIAAEALLSSTVRTIPFGEGRAAFLGQYTESAEMLIDLHLRKGDIPAAVAAARSSIWRRSASLQWANQVRNLGPAARERWDKAIADYRSERAALDAEAVDDWSLSAAQLGGLLPSRKARLARIEDAVDRARAELDSTVAEPSQRAPAAGEAILVIHPTRGGEVVFCISQEGIHWGTRPRDEYGPGHRSTPQLSTALLDAIARARVVTVLSLAEDRLLVMKATEVLGIPVSPSQLLAYGTDSPQSAHCEAGGERRAIVVADPRDDLPGARQEGREVHAWLQGRGWEAEALVGVEATLSAVMASIQRNRCAAVLYFAGHAISSDGHRSESGLGLAGQTLLTISDILTISGAPRLVLLSACDTSTDATPERLSVARAFMVAGSEAVIGTTVDVSDRANTPFMRTVLTNFDRDMPLTEAVLEARSTLVADRGSALSFVAFTR